MRHSYFSIARVISIVKMILQPDKPSSKPKSYKPISLLPTLTKPFEKLLRRLTNHMTDKNLPPDHQFGFYRRHSVISPQDDGVIDETSMILKEKDTKILNSWKDCYTKINPLS